MQHSSSKISQINTIPSQNILDINDYGIFTLDSNGIIVFWNKGAQNVQGYTADEVMGKPFAALYEKEVHKPGGYFNELLSKAKLQGYFEEEGWRQHKEGHYFWTIIVIEPIYDIQQNLIAYTVVSRNLTNRKLAAEISEITQASYKTLVLATSNIIWTRSYDGQFIVPHLQWEHFTGQIWPDYEGFGWLKMHPPEEHEKIKAFWHTLKSLNVDALEKDWQILQQASVIKNLLLKTRLWSKIHKEYRYTITSVVPRFNQVTNATNWLGNEKDIHKMAVLELHLKDVVEEQRLIINSARIGLWRWDLKTHHIKLDQNVASYFGINLENFHHSLNEIIACIHPDDQTVVKELLQKSIQTGEPFKAEFRVIFSDKSVHHIAGKGEMQYDEQHVPAQLLGSYWDITERKQLENIRLETLQLSEEKEHQRAEGAEAYKQKLEDFIDTICHEVRNPLNGIYSTITFLQDARTELQHILQEESNQLNLTVMQKIMDALILVNEQIETLDKCSRQQKVILDDALDLSKLENNKIELNPKPFNLKECIAAVFQMFHSQIVEKKLQVTCHPDINFYLVADQQRLAQIIINLVSNAIKFTSVGSIQISIAIESSSTTETLLHISIKDTGIGMTEEERTRLFQKFVQASHKTTTKYGGSGLGLVISKKLVERMGGTIQVSSQKGQGTEFNFTVKTTVLSQQEYANLQSTLLVSNSTSPQSITSKTILLADDNSMNQTILMRYLKKAGHTCHLANNGQEAVTLYNKFKFDLIFMDIEMPNMNGLQATQEIRQKEQSLGIKIPIIGLSGNAGKAQREAAFNVGMDDYLTKPYQREDIYGLIAQHTSSEQPLIERSISLSKESLLATAITIFKAEAALLLKEHYPFVARCENNFIIMQLSAAEMHLSVYLCGIILNDLKFHLNKIVKVLDIKSIIITQDYLTIEAIEQSQIAVIKNFLDKVGFDYTFTLSPELIIKATEQMHISKTPLTTFLKRSYSGSLFTLKKSEQASKNISDTASNIKSTKFDNYLKTLNNLIEQYQRLPDADLDYIAAIKHDMNNFTSHPNPSLAFASHIQRLQTELENSQQMQNQLKRE
jgi:PAS domain S-box-containing protein